MHRRLDRLEQWILDNPEKAVALPLIRRDVESLKQQATRDLESVRAENARIYDLMKWLVGLMGLVSLSLIGTAAGNVFRRDTPKEVPSDKPIASANNSGGEGESALGPGDWNRSKRNESPHNSAAPADQKAPLSGR